MPTRQSCIRTLTPWASRARRSSASASLAVSKSGVRQSLSRESAKRASTTDSPGFASSRTMSTTVSPQLGPRSSDPWWATERRTSLSSVCRKSVGSRRLLQRSPIQTFAAPPCSSRRATSVPTRGSRLFTMALVITRSSTRLWVVPCWTWLTPGCIHTVRRRAADRARPERAPPRGPHGAGVCSRHRPDGLWWQQGRRGYPPQGPRHDILLYQLAPRCMEGVSRAPKERLHPASHAVIVPHPDWCQPSVGSIPPRGP